MIHTVRLIDGWNGVLHHFQQHFSHITAIAHIIQVFPGFPQHEAGPPKWLAQGHLHQKLWGPSATKTKDPWITSQKLYH